MIQMEPIFTIIIYSHFFKVKRLTPRGRQYADQFLQKYIQRAFRQAPTPYRKVENDNLDKPYGFINGDLTEFRFHIGQLVPFYNWLADRGVDRSFFLIETVPLYEPKRMKAKIRSNWKLREEQPDVVDFLLKEMDDDNHSRLVTLPMGKGKGLCSMWAVCERGYRTAVVILPMYMKKWVAELVEKTNITEKEVMIVNGSQRLAGLIDMARNGQYKNDFVVISSVTWKQFCDAYLLNRHECVEAYGATPEEVYKLLGIGSVIIDEIHQHLHGVFKTCCFMNTHALIGLSGTFLSKDHFVDMIQHIMFPREIRYDDVDMKQYIRAYGISYVISNESMKHIRTQDKGNSSYSQHAYEKSIMKRPAILLKYLDLINEVVRNGFMDQYKPGHKCVIFVKSKAMAGLVQEDLARRYPKLDVRRYIESDPYDNLIGAADIRVTTQISGGTAHDIPGLMTNITLDNVDSQQANLQCMGRLREPKEGIARYFTVFCDNIPKHVKYYMDRKALLSTRVASFKEFRSNISL